MYVSPGDSQIDVVSSSFASSSRVSLLSVRSGRVVAGCAAVVLVLVLVLVLVAWVGRVVVVHGVGWEVGFPVFSLAQSTRARENSCITSPGGDKSCATLVTNEFLQK